MPSRWPRSSVTATVSFGKTGDSEFGLGVDPVADMAGVEGAAKKAELVEQAHQACPYSKATRGNIEVTARAA